jgi:hypothetical protein
MVLYRPAHSTATHRSGTGSRCTDHDNDRHSVHHVGIRITFEWDCNTRCVTYNDRKRRCACGRSSAIIVECNADNAHSRCCRRPRRNNANATDHRRRDTRCRSGNRIDLKCGACSCSGQGGNYLMSIVDMDFHIFKQS